MLPMLSLMIFCPLVLHLPRRVHDGAAYIVENIVLSFAVDLRTVFWMVVGSGSARSRQALRETYNLTTVPHPASGRPAALRTPPRP